MSANPSVTQSEVNELLSKQENLCNDFYEKLSSLDASLRSSRPSPEEWSVADILHHMVDSDLHFATRYIFNLTSERPTIVPFDESKYPTQLNYQHRSFEISLTAHKAIGATVRDLLSQAAIESWNRISIHPERGEKTLFELAQLGFGHLQGHINHIDEVVSRLSQG